MDGSDKHEIIKQGKCEYKEEASMHVDCETLCNTRMQGEYEPSDPFPNRRLSEIVAQILDSETSFFPLDSNSVNVDHIEEEEVIYTAFINYLEEPKKKELNRDKVKLNNIDESCLENDNSKLVGEKLKAQLNLMQQSNEPDIPKTDEQAKIDVCKLEINNSKGVILTETVFGERAPNEDNPNINKPSSESVFNTESYPQETKFRWSVTSV